MFGLGIPCSESARAKLLGCILPQVKAACDLACGTGTTAVALARSGIKMYAVDLSPTMCRLARQKAEKAGVSLQVLRADMRNFELPEPADLVLSEFDAINHVPRNVDLGLVAASAARALRPGGYFYFDVNTRLAFKKLWPRAWWIEQPDFALVLHGGYDRARDKAWTNAEWFFREGRHWRRRKERVEQVCWGAIEIRSVLLKAGFDRIRAFDGMPFLRHSPGMRRGCRTFYLARIGQGEIGEVGESNRS